MGYEVQITAANRLGYSEPTLYEFSMPPKPNIITGKFILNCFSLWDFPSRSTLMWVVKHEVTEVTDKAQDPVVDYQQRLDSKPFSGILFPTFILLVESLVRTEQTLNPPPRWWHLTGNTVFKIHLLHVF